MRPARIVFEGGVIESIDESRVVDHDFGDLVIMAGMVDSHVHVNDPGRSDWEGFETATRAAAAGGTTTIVDMPLNSVPPTTSVPGLEAKRRAAAGRIAVDVAFWGGLVPGSESSVDPLARHGVCGFKAFLVDSGVPEFPPVSLGELSEGLSRLARLELPALVHAEESASLRDPDGAPRRYRTYLDSRPVESEVRAVEGVVEIAERLGARVHILHVSSGLGADVISRSNAISGETCPHYLTFAAEDIPDGATTLKCSPPIRGSEHREALWEALVGDGLSMIVSDHSPAPPALKEIETGDFIRAWGGISSLQLRLPVVWDGASRRGADLPMLGRWLARAPAELAGIDDRKGSIAVGNDADFVIWDPEGITHVKGRNLEHRHSVTPYEGMRLRGRVVATLLGGSEVFADGTISGRHGRMLERR